MRLPFPDEPMEPGGTVAGLAGLKEYQGDPDEIVRFVGKAEALVTHLAPVSAQMLDRMPALKLIAVSRGGPVSVDVAAAPRRGVLVCNAPGRNASAVAEFTIGAILVETRMIRAGHEALRKGMWRGDLYRADRAARELSEMTVGLIDYGAVGARVVRLLKPFGCRILVSDPYAQLTEQDRQDEVKQVSLEALLKQSDVVSLHARLTPETIELIGPKQFTAMKCGAYFINTARGALVDQGALAEALREGRLAGAGLDVYPQEPLPPEANPFRDLDNVVLTPHAGAVTREANARSRKMPVDNIIAFLEGRPEHVVNPAALEVRSEK
jgi:D-3-phosphoglycerate dehydrogenase